MSADAIVRGRASLILPINVWWTRDQFIGGEKELRQNLKTIIEQGLTHKIILEKSQSVAIWKEIVALADKIQTGNPELRRYLQTSAKYGLLLYSIYEQGWIIMLKGYDDSVNLFDDVDSLSHKISLLMNVADEEESDQDSLSQREKEIVGCSRSFINRPTV